MMFLFLIGLPGCGKSFWLHQLAEALHFTPVDLDNRIEHTYRTTIPLLFEKGEPFFRLKEKETLEALLLTPGNIIVATGGGTPCFHNNMAKMQAAGVVIYLKSSIGHIAGRLAANDSRPLLPGRERKKEKTEKLEALLQQRQPTYEQASLIVDADNITLPIFVALLQPFLKT